MKKNLAIITTLTLSAFSAFLSGRVETVAYYPMGENLDGYSAGDTVSVVMDDEMNNFEMEISGKIELSKDTPKSSAMKKNSKLSCRFHQSSHAGLKAEKAIFEDLLNTGFEAWIKISDNHNEPGRYVNILSSGSGKHSMAIAVGVENTIGPHIQNNWGDINYPIKRDKWTHIALVNDEDTFMFYINGEEMTMNVISPDQQAPESQAKVGFFFDGWIDELRYFKFKSGEFNPKTDLNYR